MSDVAASAPAVRDASDDIRLGVFDRALAGASREDACRLLARSAWTGTHKPGCMARVRCSSATRYSLASSTAPAPVTSRRSRTTHGLLTGPSKAADLSTDAAVRAVAEWASGDVDILVNNWSEPT
ncbi:MAG: hypothetical protein WDW38_001171 [Sanguina aurantia]